MMKVKVTLVEELEDSGVDQLLWVSVYISQSCVSAVRKPASLCVCVCVSVCMHGYVACCDEVSHVIFVCECSVQRCISVCACVLHVGVED